MNPWSIRQVPAGVGELGAGQSALVRSALVRSAPARRVSISFARDVAWCAWVADCDGGELTQGGRQLGTTPLPRMRRGASRWLVEGRVVAAALAACSFPVRDCLADDAGRVAGGCRGAGQCGEGTVLGA